MGIDNFENQRAYSQILWKSWKWKAIYDQIDLEYLFFANLWQISKGRFTLIYMSLDESFSQQYPTTECGGNWALYVGVVGHYLLLLIVIFMYVW